MDTADRASHHRCGLATAGWRFGRWVGPTSKAFLSAAAPEPDPRKDRQQDDQGLHVLRPRITSRTNREPA